MQATGTVYKCTQVKHSPTHSVERSGEREGGWECIKALYLHCFTNVKVRGRKFDTCGPGRVSGFLTLQHAASISIKLISVFNYPIVCANHILTNKPRVLVSQVGPKGTPLLLTISWGGLYVCMYVFCLMVSNSTVLF